MGGASELALEKRQARLSRDRKNTPPPRPWREPPVMAVTFQNATPGGTEEEGSGRRNYGHMTCSKREAKMARFLVTFSNGSEITAEIVDSDQSGCGPDPLPERLIEFFRSERRDAAGRLPTGSSRATARGRAGLPRDRLPGLSEERAEISFSRQACVHAVEARRLVRRTSTRLRRSRRIFSVTVR